MSYTITQTLTVNGHDIPVKNLDKPFWPEEGITKGHIMEYYIKIWPLLAPHLRDRPLSLVRYPDGIHNDFFYQKNFPNPPPWVETFAVTSEKRTVHYVMANNLETLIWSVNLGCIEIHPQLSTRHRPHHPTYLIFDLDPMPPATLEEAKQVALALKELSDRLGLQVFPKLSGATGLHLYLPLAPIYTFKQTATFVQRLGEAVIRVFPDLATNERSVKARKGKVYIDHLQNLPGKTIAAVYSLRPFPGAPVSMPVTWDELPQAHPGLFTIYTAERRLQETGDLFTPLFSLHQHLPPEYLT